MPLITPNLLSWQLENYPLAHTTRQNLALHAMTMPAFVTGFLLVPVGAALGVWQFAALGGFLMVMTLVMQGRGHRMEPTPPLPFASPLDFVARFTLEQTVTFPRFVVSGGFARAWKNAR